MSGHLKAIYPFYATLYNNKINISIKMISGAGEIQWESNIKTQWLMNFTIVISVNQQTF